MGALAVSAVAPSIPAALSRRRGLRPMAGGRQVAQRLNPRLGMAGEAKTRGTHARTNARLAKELIEAEAPWVLTG